MPTENAHKADNLIDVGEADQKATEINLDNKGEPEKVEAPKEEKIEVEQVEEVVEQPTKVDSKKEKEKEKDEVQEYSEGVQKRIAKLTRKMREAERQKEEAVAFADAVNKQKSELEGRLSKLDKSYTSEFENRVKNSMVAARQALKTAIEAQDVDGQIKAQEQIATLTMDAANGVMSNDTDQNPCDILEIKLLDPPSFGGVVLNSDGSFDYTHDDSENFIDEYTYLLNDGECSVWDTVTVTIRIDPVPDTPPVAVADTFNCIDEGSFLQTLIPDEGVLYNDYDLDTGQNLRVVLVVHPLHGNLILNPNGTFMYNHDGGESTSDSFTYYIVDDTGLTSDTVSAYLCINPINDCPVPFDDIFTINEGEIIDSSLVINDFDVENNRLLISISSPPTLGGFSWNQDGTFKYTAPDDIPAPGPEIITFDYILSDEDDVFVTCDSTATVTIIVNYQNDCPIVENDSILVHGSTPSSRIIDVLNNDSDPDSEIDTTSVKIIGGPLFGDAISNIDGTITYNFDESPIPFDTITYSVSDYEGCEVL